MKKRITIIGINYYPEDTAIGLYTSQLASFFKENEVEVEVITGFPYYPSWKIKSDYKSKSKFYREEINGVTVYRYRQYVPETPTFFKRILHLLDFSLGSFFNLFRVKKTDVVLCIVPFIGGVFLGRILSRVKRAKLWVHIQDFEFDAVTDSNIIKEKTNDSIVFKVLFWVEKKLLNSTDLLSSISTSMILKLDNKIKPHKKRELLPNWVDLDFINPDNFKKHQYLKSSKFKILYSGNIGEKQDWDFFLKFVEGLKEQDDIEIIVVGNGSKREWLREKIKDTQNVSLYFPVAYEELSDLLCSADLHILFQKENVIDTVMPSKILAMMASKKPSLITGNLKSEVSTIMNQSKGGKYLESDSLKEVLKQVNLLKGDTKIAEEYGKSARNYASLKFSKDKILKQFLTAFEELK